VRAHPSAVRFTVTTVPFCTDKFIFNVTQWRHAQALDRPGQSVLLRECLDGHPISQANQMDPLSVRNSKKLEALRC